MIFAELPAILARQPDEELDRMAAVCREHRKKFAPIEKERADADQALRLIVQERRRRFFEPTRNAAVQ